MRTKFIGAILLCVSPAFAQQQKENPLDAIRAALANRDFDHAVELTRAALRMSPNNARLWTFQGLAFAGEGDNSNALVSFKYALKIDPDNVGALAGAAQSAYATNKSAEAVPLLNRLLRLRPDEPTAHAMLAVLEYRLGNCGAATAHFEKAGEVLRSQFDGLNAFGMCLVKLKKLDQAESVFGQALRLRPEDRRERHLLASLEIMTRKPQNALATLKPLVDDADPSADTLQLASAAYEDLGDTPKAVETLRQALLRDPLNVSLYLDFANISFSHESFQVGIDVINEGLRLQPKSADLYLARGVLYVQLAQYDKAEADFEKAQELDPAQSLGAAAEGLAAVEENDLDHALATVQAKLKQNPNDPMLLYLQARVLTEKGADSGTPEFQLAFESAERAIKLRPTLAAAREVLAKLDMETGQYKEAADQCRKALASDPQDQTALYRLIQALRKMGDKEEIPALLKRLASLREEATKEEREKYRYRLIEEGEPAKP